MSGFVKIGVDVVKSRHGLSSLSGEPPLAALMARLLPEARAGAAPRRQSQRGRSAAEDGAGTFILLRDAKRPSQTFFGGPRRKINGA